MNRLELEKQIIEEGKNRNIIVTKCNIFKDRELCLDFHVEIQNNFREGWVYKHQVETLIADLAPIEHPHKVIEISLDISRYDLFNVNDLVEVDDIWIKLGFGERESAIIDYSSVCGQYREGWVTGTVVETPKENGRVLAVIFNRDVYLDSKEYYTMRPQIDAAIQQGRMPTIVKGDAVTIGTHSWTVRKIKGDKQ